MIVTTSVTKEGQSELNRLGITPGTSTEFEVTGLAPKDGAARRFTCIGVMETAEHGTTSVRLILWELGTPITQGCITPLASQVIKIKATVAA